jgi:hypothetical protein
MVQRHVKINARNTRFYEGRITRKGLDRGALSGVRGLNPAAIHKQISQGIGAPAGTLGNAQSARSEFDQLIPTVDDRPADPARDTVVYFRIAKILLPLFAPEAQRTGLLTRLASPLGIVFYRALPDAATLLLGYAAPARKPE